MKKTMFFLVVIAAVLLVALVAGPVYGGNGGGNDDLEKVKKAKERHTDKLIAKAGVVGVAVGLDPAGKHAVLVLTKKRGVTGIPQKLDGVPVHVKVTGEIFALQPGTKPALAPSATHARTRYRPSPIGVSTGHPAITAGTIGARVKDAAGNVYVLSNNHVYANENQATIGDAVIQPGTFDGGSSPADNIGTLDDFEPIKFDGSNNYIDAAIALSNTDDLGNATLSDGYGTPKSTTVAPSTNLKVKKYGRTTLQTQGRITAINATVDVGYGSGVARFVNQIIVEPGGFSAGGDSGSLIVVDGKGKNKGNDRKPVGLLFAGSSFITVANPIDAVLARFSMTIDDGTTPPTPNNPPVADAGGPYSGNEGSAISFSGAGSSDIDGTIVSYAWDFGDGATETGVTATHTYADNGTYIVTLAVTDDKGATGTGSTSATVANVTPTASAGGPYSGTKGMPITFTGSAVDPGSLDTLSFSWDFGDGSAPASGATVTHTYAAAGSFVATLTVTDKDGAVDTDSAAVTVTAPASDTVTITKAEYRTNKERLEVRAASNDPVAVLRVFDADTNAFLGVLEGGRLRLRISPSPVWVRVDSDKGGTGTSEVRIR